MAIREILTKGDELLTKKCKPVRDFDDRLFQLLDDMCDTLEEACGVGLAGPQVGVLRRLFIIITDDEIIECINPEIIAEEGEREVIEGCLSIPGEQGYVIRPEKVTIRAQDRRGNTFERTADGLIAQAFCHENDHLDGILYDSKMVRAAEKE